MTNKFRTLIFGTSGDTEPDIVGEDMAPSPLTLAERSALSPSSDDEGSQLGSRPFSSNSSVPIRDFTG